MRAPEQPTRLKRFSSARQSRLRTDLAMRYDRDLWAMAAALVDRNGDAAVGVAVGKIKTLHDAGDDQGAFVWADVLCAVTQLLQQPSRHAKLH
jgi:hypothetical protein